MSHIFLQMVTLTLTINDKSITKYVPISDCAKATCKDLRPEFLYQLQKVLLETVKDFEHEGIVPYDPSSDTG